jgi:hypothetical protein
VYFADQRVVSREVAEREFQQRMAQAQRLFHSANARSALLSKVGATAADGQLVWDSVAGEVHFYAYNLGLPATDSHFELWFVDEQGKWTSIGSLQPASDGSCSALLRVDAGRGDILRAVVTEEPNAAPAVDVAMDRPLGPERMVADFAGSTAK